METHLQIREKVTEAEEFVKMGHEIERAHSTNLEARGGEGSQEFQIWLMMRFPKAVIPQLLELVAAIQVNRLDIFICKNKNSGKVDTPNSFSSYPIGVLELKWAVLGHSPAFTVNHVGFGYNFLAL